MATVLLMKRNTLEAGKSLRTLREVAHLTLDQVALKASVSASYLSHVERGEKEASPEWISKISTVIAETIIHDADVPLADKSKPQRRGAA